MGKKTKILVKVLKEKHMSNCPFKICKGENITVELTKLCKRKVLCVELSSKNRFIQINEDLTTNEINILCAYYLASILMFENRYNLNSTYRIDYDDVSCNKEIDSFINLLFNDQ